MLNALTVDVEEYFHPSEVQRFWDPRQWQSFPSRIDSQIKELLDLFERRGVKATFFILGWVAERQPKVIQAIATAGHEIASHSYAHQLVYELTPAAFRRDTQRSIQAIEDACGVTPRLYRAPSYSINAKTLWALEILAELGFTHDSSIYPISHDRYGIPGFSRHVSVVDTPAGPICEVPVGTVKLTGGFVAPVGGGAYMRLFPYCYLSAGIRRINEIENQPACIYFHPWEIDPAQPRLTSGFFSTVRTYAGLGGMIHKLDRLLNQFRFTTLSSVYPFPVVPLSTSAKAAHHSGYPAAAAG